MTTRVTSLFSCVSLCLVVGCGSSDGKDSPAGEGEKTSAPEQTGKIPTGEWMDLITGDWDMNPGEEGYYCARKTIDQDIYVSGFEAINPKGTHHTLLTMGEPNAPDGVEKCTVADNRTLSLFGSGVGTDPLNFPEGIAIKIEKGTQLLLNLHLFNTGDDAISGLSGTRIRAVDEADATTLAEGLLAGTVLIDIPPGETRTTIGHCTMSNDFTIIAAAPHMHQLGIYEKAIVEHDTSDTATLIDQPYDFNEQSYRLIEPVNVQKGDRVRVECTHRNTTAKTVTFGESSLSEMCFAGLYRYPAVGSSLICADLPNSPG
jgi:hypothetical protein